VHRTSEDLIVWRKHGVVFDNIDEELGTTLSFKSGSIVSKLVGEKMLATKINGKYWMYWNVGELYLATSDDLVHWDPVNEGGRQLLRSGTSGPSRLN
jgi:hypothetical protein